MPILKVGQKVKVSPLLGEVNPKNGLEEWYMMGPNNYNSVTKSMEKLKGKTVTIESIYHGQYQIEGSEFMWTDDMFVLGGEKEEIE